VREFAAMPNPSGSRSTIELTVRGFKALPGVASCACTRDVDHGSAAILSVMTEANERIFIKVSRSVCPATRV